MKNKKEKLVTVGIPSYNRPLSIERTIESVTNQSYMNLEILISDDCSPNLEVDKIIRSYCAKDTRIIYLKQDVNIGPRDNHSLLVEKASGEYFMWLADDDFICKDYVKVIMKEFIKYDDYSLIGGQTFFINTNKGSEVKRSCYDLLDISPIKRILKYLDIIEHNSIYYGIFKTKNSVNYDIHCFGSDWLHVVRLAYKGKVKTLRNISIYREDEGGASTQHFSYLDRIKMFYDVYNNIKYDLYHSSLYNELTNSELDYLSNEIRKSIFMYLYRNTRINKVFMKIKNILSR